VNVKVYPDAEAVTRAAADQFVGLARDAIRARGRFSVVLSGGSTPQALYALLAADEFASRIEWPLVYVFWGDERCVPPDHPDSNYRMAKESLLGAVPLPPENILRMRGETDPSLAADEYEQILRTFFQGAKLPRFDLIWLGMGDDGHTASLFPGTPALVERTRWVVENYVEARQSWRITLTTVAINAAETIIFLVSGASKAERFREVLKGPYQPHVLPSQLVKPLDGQLFWMVDRAAAALLQ
jgi:6-phosphogluconolactonase